ncbi:MAG: glycerol-3-phosphate 1-O-acyltransferase PlsY [Clostridiales bacterium]|nr:glycerol-3-phosphate 1-O-acyltransferase PlsY [Clostridiales bacterium]
MIFLKCVAVAVISYLLGSVNASIIISKKFQAKDIRESNSGNAGATNMLRTYGKKYGAITFLCDVIKIFLAAAIAFALIGKDAFYDNSYLFLSIAGLFCVLGHLYPCFFGFKGGKGVAVCTGMVFMIDWRVALVLFAVFLIVVFVSKYISLGSVIIALLYPVLTVIMFKENSLTLAATVSQNRWLAGAIALVFTAIVLIKHIPNIKRIINKTESKI